MLIALTSQVKGERAGSRVRRRSAPILPSPDTQRKCGWWANLMEFP
jgi:hypothetical protein